MWVVITEEMEHYIIHKGKTKVRDSLYLEYDSEHVLKRKSAIMCIIFTSLCKNFVKLT